MTYRVHLAADFQKSLRVSPRLSPVPSNGANHLPWLTFPTTGGENNSPLAPEGTNAGEPPTVLLPGIPKTGHRVLPALSARNPCTKVGTPENIPAIRGLVSVKEQLSILYPGVAPGLRPCRSIIGWDKSSESGEAVKPRPDFHDHEETYKGICTPAPSLRAHYRVKQKVAKEGPWSRRTGRRYKD